MASPRKRAKASPRQLVRREVIRAWPPPVAGSQSLEIPALEQDRVASFFKNPGDPLRAVGLVEADEEIPSVRLGVGHCFCGIGSSNAALEDCMLVGLPASVRAG
jgi:hypothetical protein